jgi:hypothetical protein
MRLIVDVCLNQTEQFQTRFIVIKIQFLDLRNIFKNIT